MHKTFSLLIACTIVATASVQAATPAPGKQVEQSLDVSDGGKMQYLIYLPENYSKDGEKVPFMLFLHGRGESYGPLSIVAKWGPPRRLAAGEQMKYLVVSPQCPGESSWTRDEQQQRILELVNHIKKNYNVDLDRMYLTGLSMGGYGSWMFAASHPKMFAAAAPICGKGNPANAPKLVNLPIWAWHGTEDTAVPLSGSVDIVNAIKAAGGTKVRLTTLEHVGHFSWQAAYQSNDLYQWFDKHTLSGNK